MKNKIFDTTVFGTGIETENIGLFFGDKPHSTNDNSIYAETNDGRVYDFDGHRIPFKIEIEEFNYLKSSGLSGDEIRKACRGKLYVKGIQCYEVGHRTYDRCYKNISDFIDSMEEKWSWYPFHTDEWLGKTIGYREQLFKIDKFIIGQACMMLTPIYGKRHKFLWEDDEDYDPDDPETHEIKVEINSSVITWYPKVSDAEMTNLNRNTTVKNILKK
jgi:hypothetical protein